MTRKERPAASGSGVEPAFGAAGKAITSATLAELFGAAVRDHQAGALPDAEHRYRHLLTLCPNHADTLQNLGLVTLQRGDAIAAADFIAKAIQINDQVAEYHYNMASACRALGDPDKIATHLERAIALRADHALAHLNLGNVRCEQGRIGEAIACYQRAVAIAPNLASAHFNLANILLELRRIDEAIYAFQQALAAEPRHAEAHAALGKAFMAQGRHHEAASHYEQALSAQPNLPGAHAALGAAYVATGDIARAVDAAERALMLNETTEIRLLFAQCIGLVRFTSKNEPLRSLLLRAFREGWARPRDLAAVSISAIKLDSVVKDLISLANSVWPERLPAEKMLGASGALALARDPLLRELLKFDLLPDLDLERVLTNLRHAILARCDSGEPDAKLLAFYCAVARQCFNNQYVFAMTGTETAQAAQLRESLQNALTANEPYPDIWPVIVGAYFPLYKLANSDALLDRAWPEAVQDLIVLQVGEPLEERWIAATLPALTKIGDGVSQEVRKQYEENPYPRWLKPRASIAPAVPAQNPSVLPSDILIAGCGTGLSTIELSQRTHNTRILSIDLSLASLSYAKRMAQKLGISNVEFAHADITQLGSVSRTFDFIDASGVLHHLEDPWHGWRLLLALLRPAGTMQVGLYSALARQSVVAARALIAAGGYQSTPDDIRRFRQDIASDNTLAKSVSQWNDFYSMDECRDLLFHVQEHRVSLPEIKSFLAANNLQFAGFSLADTTIGPRFKARFPEESALLDLDCWHVFETEAPGTFAGMYQFSVRKLAV